MHTILKITIFSIQLIACKKNSVKPKGMEFYQLEDDSDNNIKDKRCQVFDFTLPKLKSNPLITDEDIYAYDWSIHEITISQSAFAKIKKLETKKQLFFLWL